MNLQDILDFLLQILFILSVCAGIMAIVIVFSLFFIFLNGTLMGHWKEDDTEEGS